MRKPIVIYNDNSPKFGKSCEEVSWNHCTSTPHRSETNGIAERTVRRVKEGTSTVLLQSGLDEQWWDDSVECYCYLRNIQDLLSDGKTPYERRFGVTMKWTSYPVWSNDRISPYVCKRLVETTSIWSKSVAKCIPWIFAVRGENLEEGDIMVADVEELEQVDASEFHARRKRSVDAHEKRKFLYSQSQMEQSRYMEEIDV